MNSSSNDSFHHAFRQRHTHKSAGHSIPSASFKVVKDKAVPTIAALERLWDPNLLDRLHSPLTRYAD